MSLTADSPVSSSSTSSDDFAALLDAELNKEDEEEQEDEEEDDDNGDDGEEVGTEWDNDEEEEDEIDVQRLKRQKVGDLEDTVECQGSTSLETIQQEIDAPVNKETCSHPAFIREMCVRCGQYMEDGSAVALGYIHKDLKVGTEEMERLRGSDLKNLLRNKKLYLVLDLDHTLLNSTRLEDVSAEEGYLMSHTDSLQDIANGSLFKVDRIRMLTKLRPFVRSFLKEASRMYEMYVYTMGERRYALEMAELLDPERVFFNGKVIAQDDCTQKHQKGLDVVLGADSAVVIMDDTEFVWSKHKENLILMERYHYFASSGRQFGSSSKSLSESRRDERDTDGALATVLDVLKRVHEMFFNLEPDVSPTSRDVRQILKTVQREVLKDCKLVFSRVWKLGEIAQNQKLWEMAVQLGASCSTNIDPSVTHVISTDKGTEKARWALQHKKFLVHPRWIEAANYLWQRQPEENFPVNHIQTQDTPKTKESSQNL